MNQFGSNVIYLVSIRITMLLAAYNLVRFDHLSQLLNFRVLVPTKCRCCCAHVNHAEFNLLAVE